MTFQVFQDPYEPWGRGKTSGTPLARAICTPIMARVYSTVQQSAETVFCDSKAGLDLYNNPLFLLSTSTPAGGVPLGCVVTSVKVNPQ